MQEENCGAGSESQKGCWGEVGTLTAVNGNSNALKYQEIEENLWPVSVRHFPADRYYFQDDNAVHRERSTQEYVAQNRMNCLSWPAQSPMLIELNMLGCTSKGNFDLVLR